MPKLPIWNAFGLKTPSRAIGRGSDGGWSARAIVHPGMGYGLVVSIRMPTPITIIAPAATNTTTKPVTAFTGIQRLEPHDPFPQMFLNRPGADAA
jgi:hypothetical protein